MIEINFTDEKTKRHYLIIVDLLMNLFMSGFTIDLIKNEKSNLSEITNATDKFSNYLNNF